MPVGDQDVPRDMRLAELLDGVVAALATSGLQLVYRFQDPRGPHGGPSERAIFSLPGAPNRRAVFVDLAREGWVLRRQFGSCWLVCVKSTPLGQADDQIAAWVMDAMRDAAFDDFMIRRLHPPGANGLRLPRLRLSRCRSSRPWPRRPERTLTSGCVPCCADHSRTSVPGRLRERRCPRLPPHDRPGCIGGW